MDQADFAVRVENGTTTFMALSDAAKHWLSHRNGATTIDRSPMTVQREGPGAQLFLDAVTEQGFECDYVDGAVIPPVMVQPTSNATVAVAGCGVLAALLLAIPLAAAVYVANWIFGATIAIMLAVCGVIFIVAALAFGSAQNKKASADRLDLEKSDFRADVFDPLAYGSFIAIDMAGKKLAIKLKGTLYLRSFADIVAVELEQDGSSIEKTNRASQLDGVITGALLGGPAGMVVGGLSGTKRHEERVHAITLNLVTRDVYCPTIKVPIFTDESGASKSSMLHQQGRKKAQDWYGRIKAVI